MKYLILNQLGTPQSPEPQAVGEYLKEFLMDPDIIGLPRPFLDILVKVIIVPRRRFASSKKYKKVWTDKGSPLAVYTDSLAEKLQKSLGQDWKVIVAMRYGKPSIAEAISNVDLAKAEKIIFIPLYPQFAQATVGSAVTKLKDEVKKIDKPEKFETILKIVDPFYHQWWYVKAVGDIIKKNLKPDEHLLLSYHGIPVSQERKSKRSYYRECLKTTELISNYLGLDQKRVSTSFQSRVGLAKWLEPATDDTAQELATSGVKKLKVACPSFTADCLETLEEINMELREIFIEEGGESFDLIPCLNDTDAFVDGLKTTAEQA